MGKMVKFPDPADEELLSAADLARAVRTELKIRHAEARVIVLRIFLEIRKALAQGRTVELRGLGTFRKKPSRVRWGRDFSRGRRIPLKPAEKISFKVGRKLRSQLKAAGQNRA